MLCHACTEEEKRRAPINGQDVDMVEVSYVIIPGEGIYRIQINLWQCPVCKAVALTSESAE